MLNKDLNEKTLHNGYQIANLVKFTCNFFSDIDSESQKYLQILDVGFCLSPAKYRPLFGNNLAKTIFPKFVNKIMVSFVEEQNNEHIKQCLGSVVSLIWNVSDSSEIFCKELLACNEFAKNIVLFLRSMEYNEQNRALIDGALSTVSNIVRRISLRNSFEENNICELILEFEKSDIMGRNIRIICVEMIYHLKPDTSLKQVAYLADDIRDDLVEIFDAASNNHENMAEGFDLRELMEVMTVICRDKDTKRELGRNQTVSFTMLKLLARGYHPDKVVGLARAVYSEQQFLSFRQSYVDKHGRSNTAVMSELG